MMSTLMPRPINGSVDLASGKAANDGSDSLTGIEDVVGTAFHDTILGDSSANDLYGSGGNDELRASGPEDLAAGGPGSNSCKGFASEESCGTELLNPLAHVEVDLAGGPGATTMTSVVRQGEFLPQEIPTPPCSPPALAPFSALHSRG